MNTPIQPLLSVRDLKTYFMMDEGVVKAVDGVTFDVNSGQVFGIVGESGCGKSVTMKAMLRIVEPPGKIVSGEILLQRQNQGRRTTQGHRSRQARRERQRDALDSRRRDRAHPARTDVGVQPGAHHRRSDHRSDYAASARQQARGAPHRAANAQGRGHPDAGTAARCVFVAVERRPAPARHHRHGALVQPAPAHRRRADDRGGRDHAGAGAAPAAPASRRAQRRDHLHHARSGRDRADGRLRDGDVPGPGDGAGAGGRHLSRAQASVHAGAPALDPQHQLDAARRACPRSAARSRIRSTSRGAVLSIRAAHSPWPGKCDVRTPALQPVGEQQSVSCFLYHDVERCSSDGFEREHHRHSSK